MGDGVGVALGVIVGVGVGIADSVGDGVEVAVGAGVETSVGNPTGQLPCVDLIEGLDTRAAVTQTSSLGTALV